VVVWRIGGGREGKTEIDLSWTRRWRRKEWRLEGPSDGQALRRGRKRIVKTGKGRGMLYKTIARSAETASQASLVRVEHKEILSISGLSLVSHRQTKLAVQSQS
jgi:hypothetical protein